MTRGRFGALLALLITCLFLTPSVRAATGDIVSWALSGTDVWRITSTGHFEPGTNNTRNIGSPTKQVANLTVGIINATTIYGNGANTTGNATQGNMTVTSNVTTTNMIASSATNTATLAASGNAVLGAVLNVTGLTTLNNVVANTTLNVTTTLTGNTINATGLVTAANGLAHGGTTVNASNITLTAANANNVYLTNMSGNHTITLPSVATSAGRTFTIVELSNKWGGTGNVTFNVTSSGNVNLVDTYTPTNTSGAAGNISLVTAACDGVTGWSIGILRR